MPLTDWTNLMESQETSSGGQSHLISGMLWEPETSKGFVEANEPFMVNLSATFEHLETTRTLTFEGRDEHALARFICWALIAKIPDHGVEECLESIKDIHQFYTVAPTTLLPSATVQKLNVAVANKG